MNERDDWDRHWSDLRQASRYNPAQAYRRELIASLTRVFPSVDVAGAEMSAAGIEQSRAKAPQALFFQRDLSLAPNPDDTLWEWANLAVCSEVLEHVDEPEKVLDHASRYLAPGARLFITVPGGPMSAFDRHIGHRRHFTVESLTRIISEAGLIPEKVSGVGFPFFNLYRMTVILRGKALIKDATGEKDQKPGGLARMTMGAFSLVLKRGFNSTNGGWQMTAQARKPN